jgi:hypothetical protein
MHTKILSVKLDGPGTGRVQKISGSAVKFPMLLRLGKKKIRQVSRNLGPRRAMETFVLKQNLELANHPIDNYPVDFFWTNPTVCACTHASSPKTRVCARWWGRAVADHTETH